MSRTDVEVRVAGLEAALAGRRALIVASTGGHLNQAAKWFSRIPLSEESAFVTFDAPQARALLAGRAVSYIEYVRSRDWRGVVRAARMLWRLAPARQPEVIVSTGAAVALAAWPVAVRLGIEMHYIESVSRFVGPSLTGRILRVLPGVTTWSQHDYGKRGWNLAPSLLGSFSTVDRPCSPSTGEDRPLRVLVTLGTIRPYRFDRLIEAVLPLLRADDQVIWQLGSTERGGLPGTATGTLSGDEMRVLIGEVDVVIMHGGVGTALDALAAGRLPIVFARRSAAGEHVDDHQSQIVQHLHSLGLAIAGDETLARADLLRAASLQVIEA